MHDPLGGDWSSAVLQDCSVHQTRAGGPHPAHCLLFVNKTLLEHSYAYAYLYDLWLLLHHDGKVVATETIMARKA